ncbi:uncharacterized protein VTP21DRAFT_10723 [Calcarisporiella thermophila]|uniref:uncharacterized protein n=1 Tax=Calcarisporiella thermophila TaxID=911321 RepID=UPI003742168B
MTLHSLLSTIHKYCESSLRSLIISALKQGPIPRHISFVMDGNRRFARKINVKTQMGHSMGFTKLKEVLEICMDLGVEVVTVYAFSIENFKRPREEVDFLMGLARTKLLELCEQNEVVHKHGIRIRVLGNRSYIPSDVLEVIDKVSKLTENNTGPTLNICFPYTSRDEITAAIQKVAGRVKDGELKESDISQQLLEEHLYTAGCPKLDVWVRTSGEIRLSDFLLWQAANNCQIHFVDCYWPEFSIWQLLPIILNYQLAR